MGLAASTIKVEGWGKGWMQRYSNLGAAQNGACWGLGGCQSMFCVADRVAASMVRLAESCFVARMAFTFWKRGAVCLCLW